ncbi:hypothetical protein E4U54_008487 [Claviceps lovelessii]|nr:hypothetical protein E4U54_008487 [Claviceps lovelessii]
MSRKPEFESLTASSRPKTTEPWPDVSDKGEEGDGGGEGHDEGIGAAVAAGAERDESDGVDVVFGGSGSADEEVVKQVDRGAEEEEEEEAAARVWRGTPRACSQPPATMATGDTETASTESTASTGSQSKPVSSTVTSWTRTWDKRAEDAKDAKRQGRLIGTWVPV